MFVDEDSYRGLFSDEWNKSGKRTRASNANQKGEDQLHDNSTSAMGGSNFTRKQTGFVKKQNIDYGDEVDDAFDK